MHVYSLHKVQKSHKMNLEQLPMERPICEITKFLKNKSEFKKIEINHEKCSFHRLEESLPNSKINKFKK